MGRMLHVSIATWASWKGSLGCVEIMKSIRICRVQILEREQMGLPVSPELTLQRSDLLKQFKAMEREIKYLNRDIPE